VEASIQSDSISTFHSMVDDGRLWNPSDVRYDDWMRTLASRLVESKAVRNEILSLLAPFCRTEVDLT